MRKYLFICFISTFIITILICGCSKKISPTVYLDEQIKSGIEVDVKQNTFSTDSLGKFFLRLKNKEFKKKIKFIFRYDPIDSVHYFSLDTTVNITLSKKKKDTVHFYLELKEKPKVAIDFKSAQISIIKTEEHTLDSIVEKLENAIALLNKLEKELNELLLDYPNSAMKEYSTIDSNRRNDLKEIEKKIKDINAECEMALKNPDELIDTDKIHEEIQLIANKVTKFISLVSNDYGTFVMNKESNLEFDLQTDIYFLLGKYEIESLELEQLNKIQEVSTKIINSKNDEFSSYKIDELKLIIQVSGYTDGVPVGRIRTNASVPSLAEEIAPFCEIDYLSCSDEQLNICLSELRAQEMYTQIYNEIKDFNPQSKIIGNGQILAVDDKANPAIRKCEISVVFIPLSVY